MGDPRREMDRGGVQLEEPVEPRVPRQASTDDIDISDREGAERLEAFDDNEFGGEG